MNLKYFLKIITMGNCFDLICKKNKDFNEINEAKTPFKYNNDQTQDTSGLFAGRISDISDQDKSNRMFKTEAERIFLEEDEILSEELNKKVSLQDFELVKLLGEGSFGKVVLVKKRDTGIFYAMKILKKKVIEERKQTKNTKTERLILEKMNNPFVVQLHFAFQTKVKLFLVMDFMQGGELFFHLKKASKFDEVRTKFYAAEIVLALEYLHMKKIIYRDLKPENILFDVDGHIKLCDFGLSKFGVQSFYYFFFFLIKEI